MKKLPNPGSDEAVKQGCKCPVLDNGRGFGAGGRKGTFWINDECPLHVKTSTDVADITKDCLD